jgi:hypothetical protein
MQKNGDFGLGDRVFSLPVMGVLKPATHPLQLIRKVRMLRENTMAAVTAYSARH